MPIRITFQALVPQGCGFFISTMSPRPKTFRCTDDHTPARLPFIIRKPLASIQPCRRLSSRPSPAIRRQARRISSLICSSLCRPVPLTGGSMHSPTTIRIRWDGSRPHPGAGTCPFPRCKRGQSAYRFSGPDRRPPVSVPASERFLASPSGNMPNTSPSRSTPMAVFKDVRSALPRSTGNARKCS